MPEEIKVSYKAQALWDQAHSVLRDAMNASITEHSEIGIAIGFPDWFIEICNMVVNSYKNS